MINKQNIKEVLRHNMELLPSISSKVEITREQGLSFRYKPIDSIKNYLIKEAQVLQFPSNNSNYGGLVSYRNGRFYIHINTGQPKTYENLMWAHEYYHFKYEAEEIRNADIRTFFEEAITNEKERSANLFAAELLVDSRLLEEQFKEITLLYSNEPLVNKVIRLIPIFEIPYKALVVKLAQNTLIEEEEAVQIIDYPYRDNLPADFDQTILKPSMAIKINNLEALLADETIIQNMSEFDLKSFQSVFLKHFASLEVLREGKKK
ncbi:ImmA/IrrE family metallo-endopeptidase [Bacillales bacterium AN1005]